MAVNLSPIGGVAGQFFDNNGNPLSGGKIYTYASGTTTNQATYTSAAGVTAHTNPIILDSAGRVPGGEIWLTDGIQYKFVVKTSADVLIGTYDNIIGINSNFVNFVTRTEVQTATADQTVFTLTNSYSPGTNTLQVFVDGVNQYDGVSYSYVETDSTTVTFNAGLHVGALVKFTTAVTLSAGVTDASLVTYNPPFTGGVETTVEDKLAQSINVKDFGAVGDASNDDTAAIVAADAYAASVGRTLFFPSGVYKCTNGIEQTAAEWVGTGNAQMGTFPTVQDDKRYLRPGYKNLIPGSALLFAGTGTATGTTTGTPAAFNSFTYCLKIGAGNSAPFSISNMAIVMDMDVLTAGGVPTTISTDNRSNYQVGLFCNDLTKSVVSNVTVFGYFAVAGVVHYGSDPDDCSFTEGCSSGNVGFAILGNGTDGLSGTQFYSWAFYANDHHSRTGQWGQNCLLIDGDGTSINGHYFFGGRVQSYVDNPVSLGYCNNVVFTGTVFELPDGTEPGTTTSKIIATSNTRDVSLINCRWTDNPIFGADRLVGQAGGYIYLVNPPTYKGIEAWNLNKGVRIRPQPDGSGGVDSTIQLTSDANGSNTGWLIRRDDSASDVLDYRYNNTSVATLSTSGAFTPLESLEKKIVLDVSTLTIVSGAVTVSRSWHKLTSEDSPAADDLLTINGGVTGQTLILNSNTSGDVVTLKDGGGNLRLAGDFTLTNGQDRIMLMYDGTNWCELSRSDNTV